jgi:uncharacterized protein
MSDWDEDKRQTNLAKHGVDFAKAPLFDWSLATFEIDRRRAYGEVRIVATGPVLLRLHVLVYTLRAGQMRVISLRKANSREYRRWINHET